MQFDSFDFEVDFKTIKDAFYFRQEDISKSGIIITSSRAHFSSKFINSWVKFIRRQTNAVIYTLA